MREKSLHSKEEIERKGSKLSGSSTVTILLIKCCFFTKPLLNDNKNNIFFSFSLYRKFYGLYGADNQQLFCHKFQSINFKHVLLELVSTHYETKTSSCNYYR